jgi:hypothetical protein
MRRQLTDERAALEQLLSEFRAGIDRIPVTDPLAWRLIEIRAMLTTVEIDQVIASLAPPPEAVVAKSVTAGWDYWWRGPVAPFDSATWQQP